MKNFFQQVIAKNVFFFLGAAWLFTIAFIIDNYWYSSSSAKYLRKNIENDIQQQEKDFDNLLKDTALLGRLVAQRYSANELTDLTDNRSYCIFLYGAGKDGDHTLKFWNTQLILPPADLQQGSATNELVKLSNGQYECIRRQLTIADNRTLMAIALVPVRREYYLEIEKKEFINYPQADKSVSITNTPTDYPVKSITGNMLFYLQAKFVSQKDDTNWVTLTLNIVAILLLLITVHNAAHYFSVTYGYLKGIFFLTGMVLLLRGLTYFFPAVLNLRQYDLFDPVIYSSSAVLNSLGDLLINAFLFCWIVLFIRKEVGDRKFRISRNKFWYWFSLSVPLIILVVTTFVFSSIIKSLIADARISFNVANFFSLVNINSLGGFIVLATLSLSFFFLSQVILQLISPLIRRSKYILYILVSIIGLLLLTLIKSYSFVQLNIYVLAWLLMYVWFMQQHIIAGNEFGLAISEVLVWLFVFSFSISAIIVIENQRIELAERKRMAERLSNQADPAGERLLSIALTYFDNDFLYDSFDRFLVESSNHSLKDSLINKNFAAYLAKYDTRIYTFDSSEHHRPLFNDEEPVSYDSLDIIFRIEGRATNVRDLRYFSKSFDKFSYLFKKAVKDSNDNTIGYFFVLSKPKRYKSDALIPELLRPKQELLPEYSSNSSYAVYRSGRLVDYYNEGQFPSVLSPAQIPKQEYEQRNQHGADELWYKNNDNVVVIARKENYAIEGMTLFAYLFSTFLILLAVFRIFSVLIQTRLRWHLLKQVFQVNLRSQIHGTFIFITLISFIVIGVATIFFFINRYKRNNIERLSKAIQIMNNQVQTEVKKGQVFDDLVKFYETHTNDDLEVMVRRVAEIHGTDINLYDLDGNLVVSSQLIVYNKGILSSKMNPQAYYNLHNRNFIQYINDEHMGKVSYQSIYSPIRDGAGNAYAYLNIPSFDSQIELKKEISNFLVTIINLNAFIFLIAGAIALLITNRITASFTLISNKMRAINLGKTNEEIPWHRNDEIGGLVTEYNKMLNKLEASAAQLAKSEREGAWREMARQVAHEIKNPLTPMKLSIQYLQKAIDNNSPNVKEMTSAVAKTLVEQIDHLSKIAADFSQFANIGNPRSEVFDVHEILHSLASLYMATENLVFEWHPVPQRVILFADKTQLNRLFTNLLQNAVEASDNKEHKKIVVAEELQDNYIIIKISDNGDGIPLQVQEKIFTPNFTTKTSGTGLGLAMSRNIIEQAKGELWFETRENEGSVFFVKLPLFRIASN
ncbi:MAG TPA: HAMP domain-containing sensor histidine kinase [Chitinophagaceae bacterium]|nr:HAMP domain-containing sensor histidine kinase [Chitinophagaceae bacterium]